MADSAYDKLQYAFQSLCSSTHPGNRKAPSANYTHRHHHAVYGQWQTNTSAKIATPRGTHQGFQTRKGCFTADPYLQMFLRMTLACVSPETAAAEVSSKPHLIHRDGSFIPGKLECYCSGSSTAPGRSIQFRESAIPGLPYRDSVCRHCGNDDHLRLHSNVHESLHPHVGRLGRLYVYSTPSRAIGLITDFP